MKRITRTLVAMALVLAGCGGTDTDQATTSQAASSPPPTTAPTTTLSTTTAPTTTAPPDVKGEPITYGEVEVTGIPIPRLPEDGTDPALGSPMPEVIGADFAGNTVSIENDGRPKIILFLTHW